MNRAILLLIIVLLCSVTAHASGCIGTTNELVVEESKVTDLDFTREYTLCSNTVFSIGSLDFYGKPESGRSDIIPLRPNMHLKCGESGSRSNNCLVEAGDLQLEGTSVYGGPGNSLDNVVVTGLTFSNAQKHIAWINKPGDIIFQDCEFRENTNALSPLLFDYFDSSSTEELTVEFRRCDFVDNVYAGLPAQPALVVGNGLQNRISFIECSFERNDMVTGNTMANHDSFLVATTGPLELSRNCFRDNVVGVAPVAVYGAEIIANSNYPSNSGGKRCELAAKFADGMSYDSFTPVCTNFDVAECAIGFSEEPSGIPTSSPVEVASLFPTTVDGGNGVSTQPPVSQTTKTSGSESPAAQSGSLALPAKFASIALVSAMTFVFLFI